VAEAAAGGAADRRNVPTMLHRLGWWWRVGYHLPWLTWTVRGLAIWGVLAVVLFAIAASRRAPKRDRSQQPSEDGLSLGWIAFLVLVGIPSAAVLVAASVFFAPFAGLLAVIALAAVGLDTLKRLVRR
jgi:hypothetical protein